ncbi:DUF2968 domain-containing protein [Pusillimonas noertemannii]|uniref:DUF2968 domain-containing protein n=1 Tax=Pusillimonas noertemannii TaxID=305977 RepID=UPI0002FA5ED1|nr:DUF2968 domain-containing protein [Pusillimonas noertemannii]
MKADRVRKTKYLLLAMGIAALSGCAALGTLQEKPVVQQEPTDPQAGATPVTPPTSQPQALPSGTRGKLEHLIQSQRAAELRTSYNGSYGASLLFDPEALTYYVALFQNKDFWKVVDTQDHTQAERLYKQFSEEARKLAEPDLRRIRLEADYAHAEKQLTQQSGELEILRSDLQAQREQESRINAQQAAARQEAEQLARQRDEARERLSQINNQIKALEAQRSALEKQRAR